MSASDSISVLAQQVDPVNCRTHVMLENSIMSCFDMIDQERELIVHLLSFQLSAGDVIGSRSPRPRFRSDAASAESLYCGSALTQRRT
jgi:hypothetical protein